MVTTAAAATTAAAVSAIIREASPNAAAMDSLSEQDVNSVCSSHESASLTPLTPSIPLTPTPLTPLCLVRRVVSPTPSPPSALEYPHSSERERERERVKVHWMRNCSHDAPVTQPEYIAHIIEENMKIGFFNEII